MSGPRRTAVIATAGHVDHGKSTLVRALTGIEPDRWEAERRRGLTIDLGFAWMSTGEWDVSFVDVPGHERFLPNALTGLCPAPVVCFVVAAHEGWKPQSSDHRDVVAALGISAGLIVLTHADQADHEQIATTMGQVRREFANTGLRDAPIVVVSAVTGQGLEALRHELVAVLDQTAAPARTDESGATPVRLWIDRSFTMRGAGAVVTATLSSGVVAHGDELLLNTAAQSSPQPVTVREVQSRGATRSRVTAVDRVALNLRGVQAATIGRGDVLCTPDAWRTVGEFDARIVWGDQMWGTGRADARVHLGTAAVPATLRRLGSDTVRIRLHRPLPLRAGDSVALGSPHGRGIAAGAVVLDIKPSTLRRGGDAARHGAELIAVHDGGQEGLAAYIARRGAVDDRRLGELGLAVSGDHLPGIRRLGQWWVSHERWNGWVAGLVRVVSTTYADDPLTAGASQGAVTAELGLSDPSVLPLIAREAGYHLDRGLVVDPRQADQLGAAAAGVAKVEKMLQRDPFHAPEAEDLARWGLGRRELAAAERAGRLLLVASGVVLSPNAPERAMRILTELDEPFTVSQARAALGTTRRVAVPLLEHLDRRGWTTRIDGTRRKIVRSAG